MLTPIRSTPATGRTRARARVFGTVLALAASLLPLAATAQSYPTVDEGIEDLQELNTDTEFGFRRGSFVVAPIPFSNPMIGSGLALGGGYLFKVNPEAKTSVLGLGGLKSDNGSQAYGLMVNLAFGENKWLLNGFLGEADVNYDLYLPGGTTFVPVNQTGILGRLSLAYGVTPELSFGAVAQYLETSIGLEIPGLPPLPPALQPDLGLELLQVGITADWDKRDDSDYPTGGFRLGLEATQGKELDSPRTYYRSSLLFDYFRALSDTGVLAARASVCAVSSATPFFEQCSLGASDSFRGFNLTQYLDTRSASLQVEYRQRFGKRFGAVLFAGSGWVGPEFGSLTDGGTHSAAGLGLRYRVSKKFPVDFSVDVAHNDLGENLLYIYVGQRF